MPGNNSDKTMLAGFLKRIEEHYSKSERLWVTDRGIPTEQPPPRISSTQPLMT